MAIEPEQGCLLLLETYSEFSSTDNPYALDFANLLVGEAAGNFIAEYHSSILGVIIGTKLTVGIGENPDLPIAQGMANFIKDFFAKRSESLPEEFIRVDLSGTSTLDEARIARRDACGLPIISICMDDHFPRASRNLTQLCDQPTWTLTAKKILQYLEPEYLNQFQKELKGANQRKRIQREKVANAIDSLPFGSEFLDFINKRTGGGRRFNKALLRFPRL